LRTAKTTGAVDGGKKKPSAASSQMATQGEGGSVIYVGIP
jgi:hypothetical protein